MKLPRFALLFSATLFALPAFAATVITDDGRTSSNVDIAQTFGDNISASTTDITASLGAYGITGTPDINLTWTSTGGSGGNTNNWQHHIAGGATPSSGGGALQLDGGAVGSTFSILFTPGASSSVVLNSFNFLNDTGSSVNYNYTITVTDMTTAGPLFTENRLFNPTVSNTVPLSTVTINAVGAAGHALRLDLTRTTSASASGSGNDIYIDNLSFDQMTAVPEPSTYGLMGAGALAGVALVRRRRRAN